MYDTIQVFLIVFLSTSIVLLLLWIVFASLFIKKSNAVQINKIKYKINFVLCIISLILVCIFSFVFKRGAISLIVLIANICINFLLYLFVKI